MIVDVHTHLYPEAYVSRLAGAPELVLEPDGAGRVFRYQGARIFSVPHPNRTPEQRLEQMDAAGVDAQILSLGTPNVYVADLDESRALATLTNDVLADVSRTYPTRFRALASLPLGRIDDVRSGTTIASTSASRRSPELVPRASTSHSANTAHEVTGAGTSFESQLMAVALPPST